MTLFAANFSVAEKCNATVNDSYINSQDITEIQPNDKLKTEEEMTAETPVEKTETTAATATSAAPPQEAVIGENNITNVKIKKNIKNKNDDNDNSNDNSLTFEILKKILFVTLILYACAIAIHFIIKFIKSSGQKPKKEQIPAKSAVKINKDTQQIQEPENEIEQPVQPAAKQKPVKAAVNIENLEEKIDLKRQLINEPFPTDIKSAVKLFVKITSK